MKEVIGETLRKQCGKVFASSIPFKYMKMLTLERNPVYVSTVGKFLASSVCFRDMEKLYWKVSINIKCGKWSLSQDISSHVNLHSGENLTMYILGECL